MKKPMATVKQAAAKMKNGGETSADLAKTRNAVKKAASAAKTRNKRKYRRNRRK